MESYKIKDGRIISPGRFQHEPAWILELWEQIQNGMADVSLHDGSIAYDAFQIDESMSELTGYRPREDSYVVIWSNDQGFVSHMVMDRAALNAIEYPETDNENITLDDTWDDMPTKEWHDTSMLQGFDDHPEYESGY